MKFAFKNLLILLFLISISCSTDDTSSSETDNESTEENGAVGNKTSVPDNTFEQWLIDNNYDDILDNYALTNDLATIKKFCVDGLNIDDLTGLEDLTAVEEICIDGGDFVSIDLSKNTELKKLKITNSELKSLDLSNNMLLTYADLSNNKLEQLKINEGNILETLFESNILETLFVQNNNLTFLDISGNYNAFLDHLDTRGNNIECIVVNSPQLYRTHSWSKDEETIYSLYCPSDPENPTKENYTYIPDKYFEEYLISNGWDDAKDGFVLTENISEVQSISINETIFNLKGIEDFKNLTHLNIGMGLFFNLDLSDNVKLQRVHIEGNNLRSINLKENKDLEVLTVNSSLQSVDLTNNNKLEYLNLDGNKLTEIDLSNNPNIKSLFLGENNIENLDLSSQYYFHFVKVYKNGLKNIKFGSSYIGNELDLSRNNLTSLDLSLISNDFFLITYENDLSCIKVNPEQLFEGMWYGSSMIDPETTFSTDCSY